MGFVSAFEGFELPEQPQVVRAEARFLARELVESVDGVLVGVADEVRIGLEREAKADAAEFPHAGGEFVDEELGVGRGGLILVEKGGLELGEIFDGCPEFGDRFGGGGQGTMSDGVAR